MVIGNGNQARSLKRSDCDSDCWGWSDNGDI